MKRSKLLDLTAEYLVFSIITGSIGGAFLKAIDIPLSFDQIVLMTLTVFLILRIVFWNKRTAVIAFASAAVVAFIFLYKTEKPLEILNESWQFLRWQISYIGGKTELLPFLIIPTAWLWISAAGIVYFFLLTKLRWFYLPAAIGLTLIIILWFLGHRYIVRYIWFYALGLLLAWGGSRHKNLSKEYDLPSFGRWQIYVLPLAAVIILTTSFILPPDIDYKWMRLVDTVEEIEERINDRYGIFTGPRRSFRLAESGFPSSSNELGGPVQISRDLVLTVKPDPDGEVIRAIGRIYLRGTLLNEYISTGWKNTIGDVRYRFTDRLRNNRKQAAFNFDEEIWSNLHEDKLEAFFYKFEAEVVHTGIKTWTLFHPLQLEEMTVNQRSFVPFYNNKGETFTNRTVEEDEPYTFISRIPNFSNEEFVRYLKEAVPVIDWNEPMPPNLPYNDNYKEKLETVQQYYMNVPDTVPQRVYDLVEELTLDMESPYDKIRAMIDYLGQNFTYTLEPPYTPSDRDFVDYFLFDLKEGYCSYFASALAVMGRIAGIPTRYVEGFSDTGFSLKDAVCRVFGGKTASVMESQRLFSKAFKEFPFYISTLYVAPQNYGPANLFYPDKTGFRATMIGYPYDDVEGWRSIFPVEIFVNQWEKLCEGWEEGLRLLEETDEDDEYAAYCRIAKACYCHFKSTYNALRFTLLRDKRGAASEILEILYDELSITEMLYKITLEDPHIGYEASNHYYYSRNTLLEKIINVQWLIKKYSSVYE
jgi:hypothetical protein